MADPLSLALIATCVVLFCTWLRYKFTHWSRKNIPTPSLQLFLKLFKMGILQQNAYADRDLYLYNNFKQQNFLHGGTYFYHLPIYIPIDLKIIKHILQIDHQHFTDRGLYVNEKADPLSAHLFSLGGERWRSLRKKLTPTFTSGKLRMMFDTMQDCTCELQRVMTENIGTDFDVRDVMARFTTDIIGSVAFGVKCNSLENPKCEFRERAQAVFRTDILAAVKQGALYAFPELMQSLNVKTLDPKSSEFFMDVIKDTVNYREKNNVFRRDFMHLLIQLKNSNKLMDTGNKTVEDTSITVEEIAAQAFIFFEAGYESSSNTMTFALYELARHMDIQDRVREEIFQVLDKHGGVLNYDAVEEMKYLDQVLCEVLRKYPPLSSLYRKCNERYTLPGTNIVLEKGTRVLIPTFGIHNDPEYYPDPEKFDPDRFLPENKNERSDLAFLPFGNGPRICIGLRFGKLQIKVGLISLIKNFEFMTTEKTPYPLKFDSESITVTPKGQLHLRHRKFTRNAITQDY